MMFSKSGAPWLWQSPSSTRGQPGAAARRRGSPMFTSLLNAVRHFTWVDGLDILVVAFILYSFLRLIKDTRAYQMAIGLAMIGLFYAVTGWARLSVSHRLIQSFTTYMIIAIIVLFQ